MMKHIFANRERVEKYQVRLAYALAAGFLAVAFGASQIVSAAGSASMSLTPASGSYNPGNTITVTVVVNTNGNNVNAVQANFSYPTSLLQFASFDYGTSAFGIQAESSAGSGSVRMARGTITPVNGSSVVVGKAKFTVLGSTGTATLAISSGSNVVSSDTSTDILGTQNGASFSISQPAPPPSTGGSTPKSTTTTTAPKTTTKTASPSNTPTTTATPQPTTTPVAETPAPVVTSGESPDSNAGAVAEDTNESVVNGKSIRYGAAALGLLVAGAFIVWWLGSLRHRPKHSVGVVSSSENRFTPPPVADSKDIIAGVPENHTIRPTNAEPHEATTQPPASVSAEPDNDVPQLIRPDTTDKK